MAIATPEREVTLDFFHSEFGDWTETKTMDEWMTHLDELTIQANEDFDTYGGGWPNGIENGFNEVTHIERQLLKQLIHTCSQPIYGCAFPPNWGTSLAIDEIPF